MWTNACRGLKPIITIDLTDLDMYTFRPFESIPYYHSNCKCTKMSNTETKLIVPKPRSGHRIVCNNKCVYLFGGYNPSLNPTDAEEMAADEVWMNTKPLFKELWKYTISSETWTKLNVSNIPNILASSAVILSGHILMVYGGTGVPFGANCTNHLFICDLKNENDNLKFVMITTSGNSPPGQYGQSIVLINNYLYSIGGTSGHNYTCDIHRLNIIDGVWEEVYICKGTENEPAARYRHEVAFDGKRIYVLGGGTARAIFGFKTLFAFNLLQNKWEKVETYPDYKAGNCFPPARRCHSSVQFGDYTYIVGGYTGSHILKDIWRLNMNTLEWMGFPLFTLNTGAFFHSSCVTPNGKMITFGGIVNSGSSNTRSASIHTTWLTVPKLKDICWEAVTFYHIYNPKMSEKKLLKLGIPREYIEKLDPQKE